MIRAPLLSVILALSAEAVIAQPSIETEGAAVGAASVSFIGSSDEIAWVR